MSLTNKSQMEMLPQAAELAASGELGAILTTVQVEEMERERNELEEELKSVKKSLAVQSSKGDTELAALRNRVQELEVQQFVPEDVAVLRSRIQAFCNSFGFYSRQQLHQEFLRSSDELIDLSNLNQSTCSRLKKLEITTKSQLRRHVDAGLEKNNRFLGAFRSILGEEDKKTLPSQKENLADRPPVKRWVTSEELGREYGKSRSWAGSVIRIAPKGAIRETKKPRNGRKRRVYALEDAKTLLDSAKEKRRPTQGFRKKAGEITQDTPISEIPDIHRLVQSYFMKKLGLETAGEIASLDEEAVWHNARNIIARTKAQLEQ